MWRPFWCSFRVSIHPGIHRDSIGALEGRRSSSAGIRKGDVRCFSIAECLGAQITWLRTFNVKLLYERIPATSDSFFSFSLCCSLSRHPHRPFVLKMSYSTAMTACLVDSARTQKKKYVLYCG